jgi:hypothetical protein
VHIRDMGKPKEMSKNSKHPHPHGNLNHKVDDDDATSLQRCVRTSTRVQHNLGYLGVLSESQDSMPTTMGIWGGGTHGSSPHILYLFDSPICEVPLG